MPRRAQLTRQLCQLRHRAEVGAHVAIARDGIATVIVAGRAGEQRHQVQIGDAQLLEVARTCTQAGQRPGEAVDIAHRPDLPVGQEPVGLGLAGRIERLQCGGPREPALGRGGEDALEVPEEIVACAIEGVQRLEQRDKSSSRRPAKAASRPRLDEQRLEARPQPCQRTRRLAPDPGGFGRRPRPADARCGSAVSDGLPECRRGCIGDRLPSIARAPAKRCSASAQPFCSRSSDCSEAVCMSFQAASLVSRTWLRSLPASSALARSWVRPFS